MLTIGKTWLKRTYDLSIKTRLMMFFSLVILVITTLTGYTLQEAFRYLDIYEEDFLKTSAVYRLQATIDAANRHFENHIMYGSQQELDNLNTLIPLMWERLARVGEIKNPDQDFLFLTQALKYGQLAYIDSVKSTSAQRNKDMESFPAELFRARRIYGYLQGYIQQMVSNRLSESSNLQNTQLILVTRIRYISFAVIAGIGILLFIFGSHFSNTLVGPLVDLAKIAKKMADGQLEHGPIIPQRMDEVGILSNVFNTMSASIHNLVESLKEKALLEKQHFDDERLLFEMNQQLKDAQFLQLQYQISPHFFFNTLNTISRVSLFEKAPKTSRLIESLSVFFRYTLSETSRMVDLGTELDILEQFLEIQNIRFGERLACTVVRDERFEGVKIPIMTIQPLVENAIRYGVEPFEEPHEIIVSTQYKHGCVIIQVQDTGPGIPQQVLEAMECLKHEYTQGDIKEQITKNFNSLSTSRGGSTGIGLINIQRRLKIAYPDVQNLQIQNLPEGGCCVSILIPFMEGNTSV